jgi:hypothetical protein
MSIPASIGEARGNLGASFSDQVWFFFFPEEQARLTGAEFEEGAKSLRVAHE